jgi:hypothetical protein
MSPDESTTAEQWNGRLTGGIERFRHGFLQLVHAFQALHRDSLAWKRYLRICTIQAVVTLAIASLSISSARQSSEGLREERVRKALANVSAGAPPVTVSAPHPPKVARVAPARPAPQAAPPVEAAPPTPPAVAKDSDDADDKDDDKDDDGDADESKDDAKQEVVKTSAEAKAAEKAAAKEAKFLEGMKDLQTAIVDLSKEAGKTAVRRDADFHKSREELDEQLTDLEKVAKNLQLSDEDKATLLRLGGELDVLEAKTKPGFWDSALALVLSIYGALSVAQGVVIALSRDYHAAIARDASLLLGVAPEDPPATPKVRLNVAWIRRKLKQRTRSLLVFLPGLFLIYLVASPFPGRAIVTSILTSLWAIYWWVVWTASKSARAWEREGTTHVPWFLRLWHEYIATLPIVGGLARWWEALWMRFTRSIFSPAEAVEGQPVEFAGLAAARALQLVPVLKLFVRPLVPVAAARLLAERSRRSERLLTSPERATIAAERAAIPASPSAIEARDEM